LFPWIFSIYLLAQAVTVPIYGRLSDGVLDEQSHTLTRDHVFDSWKRAAHVVSGIGSYSGMYHWQRLDPP
jgi:MFS family permease